MHTKQQLKALAHARRGVIVPGAFNALSARVVADLGFEALYVTGAGVTNMWFGLPDQAFMGLTDIADHTPRIRDAVDLPLIVDADTGFGNALNTYHAVRTLERAGADCIQLEDQVSPKRCGHFAGKDVVEASEMIGKIKAACDARRDKELLIMARTDALAVEGLGSALERAAAYAAAGADMIFAEALRSLDDFRAFAAGVKAPVLANLTEFGQTPYFTVDELRATGVAMILYPLSASRAAAVINSR